MWGACSGGLRRPLLLLQELPVGRWSTRALLSDAPHFSLFIFFLLFFSDALNFSLFLFYLLLEREEEALLVKKTLVIRHLCMVGPRKLRH